MDFRTLTKDEISKLNEGHPPIVFGLDCEEAIRGLIANIELLERELAAEKALADWLEALLPEPLEGVDEYAAPELSEWDAAVAEARAAYRKARGL